MGFDGKLFQHGIDFRSPSVDENHIDSDQTEEQDILHHRFLQFRVRHGVSTILCDHISACIFFDVRYGLGENLRPYRVGCIHRVPLFNYPELYIYSGWMTIY